MKYGWYVYGLIPPLYPRKTVLESQCKQNSACFTKHEYTGMNIAKE